MSTSQASPSSDDDLQFSTVEPASEASATASIQTCAVCGQAITGTYFALADKLLCPTCRARIAMPPPGSRVGRVAKATLMGLGAGLVGAVIWFAIRRIAHLEIGLVAIVVGFFVGKAVRKGSGNRGGRGYQILAVLLTYCCIAANYMPDVLEAALSARNKHQAANAAQTTKDANLPGRPENNGAVDGIGQRAGRPEPNLFRALWALIVVAALVFALSLAVPFLPGAANIIGLLIIGFALWETWKLNARRLLPISGPYQLAPVTSSPPLQSTVAIANAPAPTESNVAGGQ
jgi:hypothetical protein